MKKNGFIATSILYSFFLIFLTLFIGLVANYIHNRILLSKLEESSREILTDINNIKITDLEVGDHIRFSSDDLLLSSDATWIVAYIETSGTDKTYYFISDLTAQKLNITYQIKGTDKIAKVHPMTVNLYETLINDNAYANSITYGGFNISMVTSSFLSKIRSNTTDSFVLQELMNASGNYLVYIDNTISGYTTDSYYEIKKYNFSSSNQNYISSYCAGKATGSTVTYNTNNTFGYINVSTNAEDSNYFVDYCYYSSPVAYTHYASHGIVDIDENKTSDVISTKLSNLYNFRMMAYRTFSTNATNTYISGGRGTSIDPYIFTDGVKK